MLLKGTTIVDTSTCIVIEICGFLCKTELFRFINHLGSSFSLVLIVKAKLLLLTILGSWTQVFGVVEKVVARAFSQCCILDFWLQKMLNRVCLGFFRGWEEHWGLASGRKDSIRGLTIRVLREFIHKKGIVLEMWHHISRQRLRCNNECLSFLVLLIQIMFMFAPRILTTTTANDSFICLI